MLRFLPIAALACLALAAAPAGAAEIPCMPADQAVGKIAGTGAALYAEGRIGGYPAGLYLHPDRSFVILVAPPATPAIVCVALVGDRWELNAASAPASEPRRRMRARLDPD
jgi:hypothetical protein